MKVSDNSKSIDVRVSSGDSPALSTKIASNFKMIDATLEIDGESIPIVSSESNDISLNVGIESGFVIEHKSGKSNVVYVVTQDDTTDIEKAVKSLGKKEFKQGDMIIIVTPDESNVAGYIFTDKYGWVTFSGNVYADNVIFTNDILCAGEYSQVGNIVKDTKGTETIESKGKSLADVMSMIFTKELQPTKTEPSASISLTPTGRIEVGTVVTPSYNVSFNGGKYSYDNDTRVSVTGYSVTDSDGHSSTTSSGSFSSFTVKDSTNYKVTTTVQHTAGTIAKTNLGNNSNPIVQIQAGSKSATSSTISGYRAFFYGILLTSTDEQALDSTVIRSLTNGKDYNGSKTVKVSVNGAAAKRIVVAVPGNTTRAGLTKVNKTDGLVTDITTAYKKVANVQVADLQGNNPIDYKIWVYEPASIDAAEVHEITLG